MSERNGSGHSCFSLPLLYPRVNFELRLPKRGYVHVELSIFSPREIEGSVQTKSLDGSGLLHRPTWVGVNGSQLVGLCRSLPVVKVGEFHYAFRSCDSRLFWNDFGCKELSNDVFRTDSSVTFDFDKWHSLWRS